MPRLGGLAGSFNAEWPGHREWSGSILQCPMSGPGRDRQKKRRKSERGEEWQPGNEVVNHVDVLDQRAICCLNAQLSWHRNRLFSKLSQLFR